MIIYGALGLGGVETFFVRLAKERAESGLTTKVLLMEDSDQSNCELLTEMRKYASVFFRNDIFYDLKFIGDKVQLFLSPRRKVLKSILSDVSQVHVANGMHALVAMRLLALSDCEAVLTVGFYHSLEFAWKGDLPYFEQINRKFVLGHLPKSSLLLFSESIIEFYWKHASVDLAGANVFRLGVIDRSSNANVVKKYQNKDSEIRLCSVGRLVDFKTYNIWMLNVVSELRERGYSVSYDVYGNGPLKDLMLNRINELRLNDVVELKGEFNYSAFNEVVLSYDVFVGSGTAIIQAAAQGVCSIVGIESIEQPETYGFFSECAAVDYNIKIESLKKVEVIDVLEAFFRMDARERQELSNSHRECVEQFYMDTCSDNFERLSGKGMLGGFSFSRVRYVFSYLFTMITARLKGEIYYERTRKPID